MPGGDRIWIGHEFLLWVGDADDALLNELDIRIQQGEDPASLLAVITSAGLDAAPAFACATVEGDSVRTWVRGRGRLELCAQDGSRTALDADGVRTWRESVHDAIDTVVPGVEDVAIDWLVRRGARRTELPAPQAEPDGPWYETAAVDGSPSSPPVVAGNGRPPVLDPEDEPEPSPHAEPAAAEATDAPPVVESHEFDFSNLLEHTRYRDVESAAVRQLDADPEGPDVPGRAKPHGPQPDVAAGAESDGASGGSEDEVVPGPAPRPLLDSETLGVEPEAPGAPHSRGRNRPLKAQPTVAADDDRPAMISYLPGQPVATDGLERSDEPPADLLGDHDGRTMTTEQLRRMASESLPRPVRDHVGPQVRAVICPGRHPNPPSVDVCRLCARPIADRSVHTIARPTVARAHFETGMVVELDRPQILGRRPTAEAWTASSEIPGLVTLPSPDGELSRVHAAVHIEEWEILVEDWGSTNGTEVQLPGQERERLREHTPRLIVPGTEVTLAGVTSFTLRVPRS